VDCPNYQETALSFPLLPRREGIKGRLNDRKPPSPLPSPTEGAREEIKAVSFIDKPGHSWGQRLTMMAINYVSCSRTMDNRKGFTLIEIIVVLAILGILIAAIVPTYAALLTEAENKAALCAVAEGKARLTNQYAKMLLKEDPKAQKLSDIVESVSTDAGDYRLVFTVSKDHKEVEITAIDVRKGATGKASASWKVLKDD